MARIARINQDKAAHRLPRGSPANKWLLSCKSCKSCKSEQDIQDIQDVQDEEACGSPSVSLVMKPLILAILAILAILLRFSDDAKTPRLDVLPRRTQCDCGICPACGVDT